MKFALVANPHHPQATKKLEALLELVGDAELEEATAQLLGRSRSEEHTAELQSQA